MTLTYVPLNTTNTVIQAADINQAIKYLQQPSGGQELSHYYLEGPAPAADTVSMYVTSHSRGSTPVSATVDVTDQAMTGLSGSLPITATLKSYGVQVYAITTSAQQNARCGGAITFQY